jgi:NADH-quinone oxidoreductase subunit E
MSCLKEQFDELRKIYPDHVKAAMVLPLLQLTLKAKGHLTEPDAVYIAEYLELPTMQVKEAMTWYSMLYRTPVGQNVVKVCRSVACSLRGEQRIVAHISKKLGLKPGETSADGKFTLLEVECLASCGTAPMMQINDTYHEDLTEAKIDQILEAL